MKRSHIIILVALVVVAGLGFFWWRRRQMTAAQASGLTASTPQPQAALAALQAPGAPFGLPPQVGNVINAVAGLLPPIGYGTQSVIPRSGNQQSQSQPITTALAKPFLKKLF